MYCYNHSLIILTGSEAIFSTTFVKSILATYTGLQIFPATPFVSWVCLEHVHVS